MSNRGCALLFVAWFVLSCAAVCVMMTLFVMFLVPRWTEQTRNSLSVAFAAIGQTLECCLFLLNLFLKLCLPWI